MQISILYEDADFLVLDKPPGLIVHSDGRTKELSVGDFLVEKYPQTRGVGEPWRSPQGEIIDRPGIVHRLDRLTSGVMIVAKTNDAHAFMKAEFQKRSVKKEYRAYVYGHMKEGAGTIDAEIERIRSSPPRWGARGRGSGTRRAAVTDWKMLERGYDGKSGEKVSFLSVSPKTGRTHQIRVHLQSIHHSVVCDPLYAKGRTCILGFSRLALHAYRLTVPLPNGMQKTFEAPLPDDFLEAARRFASVIAE
ncbi:MAG: RluA family pseudouridine synthase [Patescibacteria group bacterium]|nr:RluA family pseudouridine synthase [Patescibacteria group bacterium]